MFEMAQLHEDALREYDELELCYLETGVMLFSFLVFFSWDKRCRAFLLYEYVYIPICRNLISTFLSYA